MTAKLYLDEDVTFLLARALGQRGHDVVSAIELGRIGLLYDCFLYGVRSLLKIR